MKSIMQPSASMVITQSSATSKIALLRASLSCSARTLRRALSAASSAKRLARCCALLMAETLRPTMTKTTRVIWSVRPATSRECAGLINQEAAIAESAKAVSPPIQPPTQALNTRAGKNMMNATRCPTRGVSASRRKAEAATLARTSRNDCGVLAAFTLAAFGSS